MSSDTERVSREPYEITRLSADEAVLHAEEIVAIYRDSWLDTYPNESYGVTVRDLEDHFKNFDDWVDHWRNEILNDEDRSVRGAELNGDMVGFCVAKKGEEVNEMEYLYLLPGHQGRGLGTRLMRFGFELMMGDLDPKVLKNGTQLPTMRMMRPMQNGG